MNSNRRWHNLHVFVYSADGGNGCVQPPFPQDVWPERGHQPDHGPRRHLYLRGAQHGP